MIDRRAVLMAAIAGVAAGPAFGKMLDTSVAALQSPGSGLSLFGVNSYSTGFEAAEGFGLGPIDGQAGWTTFLGTAGSDISGANPAGGAQHFRIGFDAGNPAGTLTGGFSPDIGAQAASPSSLSVDVAISAADGADYDVVPQAPSQALLSARVKFSWLGDILVLDDTGGGLAFTDTGFDWIAGGYKNLQIDIDPTANTIDYYYDDSLIYSSVAGVFAGSQIEQVVLLSDNFQIDDTGDFDNLMFANIPAPAALALFGLVGLAGRRRR